MRYNYLEAQVSRPVSDPSPVSSVLNHRWSLDLVSDQLAISLCFRVLKIMDDHGREYIG